MKRYQILISGRVQGVFFRASAKDLADSLHLEGTVQNMPDGSVYVEVQGDSMQLKEFLNWCYQGPDLSKVEKVEFTIEEELKKYSGFEILR